MNQKVIRERQWLYSNRKESNDPKWDVKIENWTKAHPEVK